MFFAVLDMQGMYQLRGTVRMGIGNLIKDTGRRTMRVVAGSGVDGPSFMLPPCGKKPRQTELRLNCEKILGILGPDGVRVFHYLGSV